MGISQANKKTLSMDEHEAQHFLHALSSYIKDVDGGIQAMVDINVNVKPEVIEELKLLRRFYARVSREINNDE